MSSQPVEPEPTGEERWRQADSPRPRLIAEFWDFLKHNKRWWLLPILIVVFMLGVLVILSGTGAALFVYPSV